MRAAVQSIGETPTTQFQGALLDLKEVAATLFPIILLCPSDQTSVGVGGRVRHHDQSQICLPPPLGHRGFDFVGIAQRGRHHFDRGAAATAEANQLAGLASGLDKMGTRDVRCDLPE
jgi:hypothetical protein